ncbi:MAG: cytochrome c biogenesis protein CcdA [Thermaceae bacterium]|nr:cytochrome c biogenesis protein CcdA [Thermaceae bacterium]
MSLTFTAAFLAGMLSFLSPCVLPLVPTYLLYLGGERGRPLLNAVFFVAGFSAIFLLFGLPFTIVGNLLLQYRKTLSLVGGLAMILMGLYMLGLKPKFLAQGFNLRYQGDTSRPWGAFVLGAVLGIGWTPCIGPILGGILTLTATGAGFPLLLVYVLGLAVPFLVVALFADRAREIVRRMNRLSRGFQLVAGTVLMAVGLLMATGQFTLMNSFFLKLTPQWLLERL